MHENTRPPVINGAPKPAACRSVRVFCLDKLYSVQANSLLPLDGTSILHALLVSIISVYHISKEFYKISAHMGPPNSVIHN